MYTLDIWLRAAQTGTSKRGDRAGADDFEFERRAALPPRGSRRARRADG